MPRHRIEKAIVFNPGPAGDALLIAGHGVGIESDEEDGLGPDEIGPVAYCPEEPGLWYWEGVPVYVEERTSEGTLEGGHFDFDGHGTWRRLTSLELFALANGDLLALIGPPQLDAARDHDVPRTVTRLPDSFMGPLWADDFRPIHPAPPAPMPPARPDRLVDLLTPTPVGRNDVLMSFITDLRTGRTPSVPAPLPIPPPPPRPVTSTLTRTQVCEIRFVAVALHTDEIITDPAQVAEFKRKLKQIAGALEAQVEALPERSPERAAAMVDFNQALQQTYQERRRTILVKRRLT